MTTLAGILWEQWQGIRRLTYDYLDNLEPAHLSSKLPFPESQSLQYQFYCMLGAQESYLRKLQTGRWQGFSSSLDTVGVVTPQIVKRQMQQADGVLENLLHAADLEDRLQNGQAAYEVVFQMIKHEMHHHGQLINFMFYLRLPIPASWEREWALRYEG